MVDRVCALPRGVARFRFGLYLPHALMKPYSETRFSPPTTPSKARSDTSPRASTSPWPPSRTGSDGDARPVPPTHATRHHRRRLGRRAARMGRRTLRPHRRTAARLHRLALRRVLRRALRQAVRAHAQKKTPRAAERLRDDVALGRRLFEMRKPSLDAGRLVFLHPSRRQPVALTPLRVERARRAGLW